MLVLMTIYNSIMKKILFFLFLLIGTIAYGQLESINVGTAANDGTGDPLRTAFQKVNLTITQVNTNTTAIGLRAPLASPTFTGTVVLPSSTSIGDVSSTEIGYVNGVTSAVQTQFTGKVNVSDTADMLDPYVLETDAVDGSDVYVELADTLPQFNIVVGVGNAGDTIGFTLNNVIWGVKWLGSQNLVITGVNAVVAGTTPDIDLALLSDANFKDGTPTEVFSSDLTATSTTTGDDATINASNDTIEPDTFLWLRVDQATAKPTQLVVTIYGYLE